MKVLITGGAGFVGSHLTDELVRRGHRVRIFDNLCEQVHRDSVPTYLNKDAEFVRGDVRQRDAFAAALGDVDAVAHMASAVGVAQSQYQVKHYVDVNIGGTANLADILITQPHQVSKILLAGSMTSYGEGAARCEQCGPVRPRVRTARDGTDDNPNRDAELRRDREGACNPNRDGIWNPHCPKCRAPVESIPTDEQCDLLAENVYALTKCNQEKLLDHAARQCGIGYVCLRLFNVYGPRQSLANPYTGVAAIFIARVKKGAPPVVFEDGGQSRDFVWVGDVVRAMADALETDKTDRQTLNLGSGAPTSILDLACKISSLLGNECGPQVTGQFRRGDIRHCTADITRARQLLHFEPEVGIDEGLRRLIRWSLSQPSDDGFDTALGELKDHDMLTVM